MCNEKRHPGAVQLELHRGVFMSAPLYQRVHQAAFLDRRAYRVIEHTGFACGVPHRPRAHHFPRRLRRYAAVDQIDVLGRRRRADVNHARQASCRQNGTVGRFRNPHGCSVLLRRLFSLLRRDLLRS